MIVQLSCNVIGGFHFHVVVSRLATVKSVAIQVQVGTFDHTLHGIAACLLIHPTCHPLYAELQASYLHFHALALCQ